MRTYIPVVLKYKLLFSCYRSVSSLIIGCFVQESSEFHKRSFECAVDSIRAIAARHLWQVLNVKFDLFSLGNIYSLLYI